MGHADVAPLAEEELEVVVLQNTGSRSSPLAGSTIF